MKATIYAWTLGIGVGVYAMFAVAKYFGSWYLGALAISICFLTIGLMGAIFLEKKLVDWMGIPHKRDGAKKYKIVRDLIRNGWSYEMPDADSG